jgi:hypothetical protein
MLDTAYYCYAQTEYLKKLKLNVENCYASQIIYGVWKSALLTRYQTNVRVVLTVCTRPKLAEFQSKGMAV